VHSLAVADRLVANAGLVDAHIANAGQPQRHGHRLPQVHLLHSGTRDELRHLLPRTAVRLRGNRKHAAEAGDLAHPIAGSSALPTYVEASHYPL